MTELRFEQASLLRELFAGWHESFTAPFFDGEMGRAWVDDPHHPAVAQIYIGGFSFLAGDPGAPGAAALVNHHPEGSRRAEVLLVPREKGLLDPVRGTAERVQRYATEPPATRFSKRQLRDCVDALSRKFELRRIDEALYHRCLEQTWTRDFVGQFRDARHFLDRGIGFVALRGDEIVGGASSFLRYRSGIELQVEVRPEVRRRGIASACSARLIQACVAMGIYPGWDAASIESVRLAEKLGYHIREGYNAYRVRG